MNTSSTTSSGRSPLRPGRVGTVTAIAAIALSATVGLGIAHASASASASATATAGSADPGFDGSGLPSVEGWIRDHGGRGHGH